MVEVFTEFPSESPSRRQLPVLGAETGDESVMEFPVRELHVCLAVTGRVALFDLDVKSAGLGARLALRVLRRRGSGGRRRSRRLGSESCRRSSAVRHVGFRRPGGGA